MYGENTEIPTTDSPKSIIATKWPEIPVLSDYSKKPDDKFWNKFPKREMPSRAETKIDVDKLECKVHSLKEKMTCHQLERAEKAIDYLRNGAPAFQTEKLSACFVENSKSTLVHGRQVTENIATWIKEGYAAGPFDGPPCPNFRVNPLLAIAQPGKVRVVVNFSAPKKFSFNDNVDSFETETVKMASAKKFSQNLLDCGQGEVMSKHDLVAAYKQIPCKTSDLRLQGFSWLGKYFVETRQVFGAKTSVCNYDILGETLKLLALLESNIPHHLVLRQVDDVPSVAPAGSGLCEDFSQKYRELCEDLNVELAENCPLLDKAFECQHRGKVLGVMFDATDLTWRVSDSKIRKTLECVERGILSETCTLKEWQQLLGRINDISQMCPFMKIFRMSLNQVIGKINSDAPSSTIVLVSTQAREDLKVWKNWLTSDLKWLPIPPVDNNPPLCYKEFVSDAAGLADTADIRTKPGCGNVGFCESGKIIFANQFFWPAKFIQEAKDEKDVRFGDKTTTLEMIGLIMPLLLVPELLVNQHIVIKVDCFGTIYGMENRSSKGDITASIFIRAAYMISAYLGCVLHIVHLPRMSDWGAEVTDRLSRQSSSTLQDKKLVKAFSNRPLPSCLLRWFENPVNDWQLAKSLLEHVRALV